MQVCRPADTGRNQHWNEADGIGSATKKWTTRAMLPLNGPTGCHPWPDPRERAMQSLVCSRSGLSAGDLSGRCPELTSVTARPRRWVSGRDSPTGTTHQLATAVGAFLVRFHCAAGTEGALVAADECQILGTERGAAAFAGGAHLERHRHHSGGGRVRPARRRRARARGGSWSGAGQPRAWPPGGDRFPPPTAARRPA